MKKLAAFAFTLFVPFSASADDLAARAQAAWQNRDDLASALQAVEYYRELSARPGAGEETRVMLARAAYWAIELDEGLAEIEDRDRMDKGRQAELAELGIRACREVLAGDEENHHAHYWLIWNMAARTLARGIFSGFAFKDSIMGTIMVAKADADYEHGGIYRYWARIIHEMPSLLGKFFHFTDEDAVNLYRKAIAVDNGYLRNHFWLAETYLKQGQNQKARAEYEFCRSQKPEPGDEKEPENRLYRKWAEKRLEDF